ncbi:helix-turn-helix transcriptional regulator [Chryseobacterium indologenes]|uniref:AraC family transcriptional regulator n=1 Tax=Chryseobacterium TaxID=59732 RepID=UPI0003E07BD7|nr:MULTISPECIES: AraC family transcriptional regulator [Chryseobacterium]MBF6644556.1 helix-turn-helix transcriptional regulator [Chryseobacterium indologenes]MBU3047962.1 AraC family transcriptional regulator [Chryseobacterium indologenes]MEB4759549.1 AraC family transcriptional regulator [Chryseobacterium indologenes]QIX82914.1 helix-turn-helix transcriptional regulator [Chryseobacterium indologenes]QPQ51349.1 helix-turn-helix transcriptional regulator [Chryseobacterium indologenes]
MQISPPPHLAPFIRHYIYLENSREAGENMRLFTDGSTGLILSGDMNLYSKISGDQMPLSFFYGVPDTYKDFYSKGKFSLIAVVFQPYFLNILLKTSAKEVRNQIISVEDVVRDKLQPFQEKLFTQTNPLSVINGLNLFFSEFLAQETKSDYSFISTVQQYILKNKGSVSSKELELFTGYSERHLERKFEDFMGVSPKKYSTIIRLHYFLSLINRGIAGDNMTALSYNAGYSDQSHLIRDFKTSVGLTPRQYIKTKNKMAVNFIEL